MHAKRQFSQSYVLKKLSFPIQKAFDHICEDLSGLLILFCSSVSVFMLVPHCFDYCVFVKSFEIRKCEAFNCGVFCFWFFFFFRIVLDIQGTLRIHMKFRMDFFKFLQKMPLGFWYGLHEICGSLFMLLTC